VSPTVGDIAEFVMTRGRNVGKTIVHFGSPEGTTYGDIKRIIVVSTQESDNGSTS